MRVTETAALSLAVVLEFPMRAALTAADPVDYLHLLAPLSHAAQAAVVWVAAGAAAVEWAAAGVECPELVAGVVVADSQVAGVELAEFPAAVALVVVETLADPSANLLLVVARVVPVDGAADLGAMVGKGNSGAMTL